MGRPSLYSEEMQQKADEYLEKYKELGDMIPMVESMALYLGTSKKPITRQTLYNWAKIENEDGSKCQFFYTLERCNKMQRIALINNGLSNAYNAQITKLMLGTHGISEKTETKTDLTSKGDKLQTITFLPVGKDG